MKRRERWQKVLDTEMQRWSALSCDELVARLSKTDIYVVEVDAQEYQVEIEILENTAEYVHVAMGVDDGSLPASIFPAAGTFIVKRPNSKG